MFFETEFGEPFRVMCPPHYYLYNSISYKLWCLYHSTNRMSRKYYQIINMGRRSGGDTPKTGGCNVCFSYRNSHFFINRRRGRYFSIFHKIYFFLLGFAISPPVLPFFIIHGCFSYRNSHFLNGRYSHSPPDLLPSPPVSINHSTSSNNPFDLWLNLIQHIIKQWLTSYLMPMSL